MSLKLTRFELDAILDALIDTGAPLDPAAVWVGIAEAVTDAGVDTVLADLTRPALADYPRKLVTAWGTPYSLSDGSRAVNGPLMQFVTAAGPISTTVAAYYLVNSATVGDLLAWDLVVPNAVLAVVGDAWNLVVRVVVDPAGRWSASIYFNG